MVWWWQIQFLFASQLSEIKIKNEFFMPNLVRASIKFGGCNCKNNNSNPDFIKISFTCTFLKLTHNSRKIHLTRKKKKLILYQLLTYIIIKMTRRSIHWIRYQFWKFEDNEIENIIYIAISFFQTSFRHVA